MIHRFGALYRSLGGAACVLAFACAETSGDGHPTESGDASGADVAAFEDVLQADAARDDTRSEPSDAASSEDDLDTPQGAGDADVDPGDTPEPLDGSATDVPTSGDSQPDEDAGSDDVGLPDSDLPDTDVPDPELPPAPELDLERWGQRLIGTPLELSRVGRELWVGTRGNPLPPDFQKIRGGLMRLDLDSGQTTLFEEELPLWPYDLGTDVAVGPIPAASVQADLTPAQEENPRAAQLTRRADRIFD